MVKNLCVQRLIVHFTLLHLFVIPTISSRKDSSTLQEKGNSISKLSAERFGDLPSTQSGDEESRRVLSTLHLPFQSENSQEEVKEEIRRKATKSLADLPNLDAHFTYTNDLLPNFYELEPTKLKHNLKSNDEIQKTVSVQGEGKRVPRGRLVNSQGPSTASEMTNAEFRNSSARAEPDIRDIITGFVKLLNGASGRPITDVRPTVRRRINNRGPPRITDLPPFLLDSSITALKPPPLPKDPPPYPFEIPNKKHIIKPFVSGVPLPEQIVPTESIPTKPMIPKEPLSSNVFIEPSIITPITQGMTTKNITESVSVSTSTIEIKPTKVLSKIRVTNVINSSVNNIPTKIFPTFIPKTTTPLTTTIPQPVSEATINKINFTEKSSLEKKNNTDNQPLIKKPSFVTKSPQIEKVEKPILTSAIPEKNNTPTLSPAINASNVIINATESSTQISTEIIKSSLQPSIVEISPSIEAQKPTKWEYHHESVTKEINYAPRPGIVLDDLEYKPGGKPRPIVTAVPTRGEIFDITVSAVHGAASATSPNQGSTGKPHIYPVELEGVSIPGAGNGDVSVITAAQEGQHYVSIDGKRTYINLFGNSDSVASISPSSSSKTTIKPTMGSYTSTSATGKPGQRPKLRPSHKRPPPVRIDTCIVGDWSTCDSEQHETCRTEMGVSSCHCAPGYSRHSHRQPCKRVISLYASIKVEKMYEQHLKWIDKYNDAESHEYIQLEYEAVRAIESAMSMTPFSDIYMGSKLNNIFTNPIQSSGHPVFVNMTIQIEANAETVRQQIKGEIQKQLLGAIHRRSNNIGTSALWTSSINGVSSLQDIDECSNPDLNDCHAAAVCRNIFGSFECTCPDGYKDEFMSNPYKSGRRCQTCSPDYCNHRGSCSYRDGQPTCSCTGNYYGSQCEVDGEVLGVAIGASVAAVVIILSTLACLCMWSRKWNKEQKAIGIGSPVFGYLPSGGSTVKTPGIGSPPYQVSLEDRLRWAQIADAMAQATNHYAPEPVGGPTRPSSAMFGYGTLPVAPLPLPRLGLRPGSIHNLRQESSSEEEDRADLLGRNFQVPRPKSRSSIANQSGIYYDVDYEQGDHFSTLKHPPIPLNTYTMGRSHYYRT